MIHKIAQVVPVVLALCIASHAMAGDVVPNNWLYSTDIASDLDASDPVTPLPYESAMDCGAIYYGDSNGYTLFKADGYSLTSGWRGYPGGGPQPYPDLVGKEIPGTDYYGQYDDYFDLDSEDQLDIHDPLEGWNESGLPEAVLGPQTVLVKTDPSGNVIDYTVVMPSLDLWSRLPESPQYHLHPGVEFYNNRGAYHSSWHKNKVYFSMDDDNGWGWTNGATEAPPGFCKNPYGYSTDGKYVSIPTDCTPDSDVEIFEGQISLNSAVPQVPQMTAIAYEGDLGLGLAPNGTVETQKYDDDVDGLDWHPIEQDTYDYRYWSPDHEAQMDLDPSSIYGTFNGNEIAPSGRIGPLENYWQVLTPAHFGVDEGTDIDSFEWISLDSTETHNLFGYSIDWTFFDPNQGKMVTIPMSMLAALFSVDLDDPATSENESGGLSPGTIYLSDLEGHYVAVSPDYGWNIDGIALVPEPASLSLLALGGLAMLRHKGPTRPVRRPATRAV